MPEETKRNEPERTPFYSFCRGLFSVVFRTIAPVGWRGKENVNALDAPYILISNHRSFIDPFALAVPTKRYEIRFIGKREITKNRAVAWAVRKLHMIPVSRHETDMAAMRSCMQAVREGHVLGIFPEGTRHLPELMQT
ncbi:MAG: 1-acyl-sn-glycerol-3-phosphate acyltransferase, partial [Clostridia bacterium]|nr:1-acyl-sn-glycerol-3-phosphate acyltransferase [Clostridia bacterium]